MISADLFPAAGVTIGLCAALLILFIGNRVKPNVRESITVIASFLMAGSVIAMIPGVLQGESFEICLWKITDGIDLTFKADGAGMVFALIASVLWILTSIYSIGYMRKHHEANQTGYFAAFAVCLASAMGIAFAANLITFFIFFEMLTIATYPLVVHYRDEKAKKAGRKYLAYTLISGQLFFVGILILYGRYGDGTFQPGGWIESEDMSKALMLFLFLITIAPGMVKAGMMPFHGWLPSAMVAPTPVSALLHAVAVVKAGVFCILRIVCYVFGPGSVSWCGGGVLLSFLAAGTIVISSLIAMRQDHLKARLAYSTIGQLSYIVLGICILTPYSITGALFHMTAHAFLKITLFMCAGAIYVTTGISQISEMRGGARSMPCTMLCFTIASFGIAGLPLMAGFVSKMDLMRGAMAMGLPFFLFLMVGAGLLAIGYLLPVIQIAYRVNDSAADMGTASVKEAAPAMLIPLVITGMGSVLLGVVPDVGLHLYALAQLAAEAVTQGGGMFVT